MDNDIRGKFNSTNVKHYIELFSPKDPNTLVLGHKQKVNQKGKGQILINATEPLLPLQTESKISSDDDDDDGSTSTMMNGSSTKKKRKPPPADKKTKKKKVEMTHNETKKNKKNKKISIV